MPQCGEGRAMEMKKMPVLPRLGDGQWDEQVEHEDFSVSERIPCRVPVVTGRHLSRHMQL